MVEKIYVQPKPGLVLRYEPGGRNPAAQPLPAAGGWWPDDQFTKRRIRDGDLVVVDPQPKRTQG